MPLAGVCWRRRAGATTPWRWCSPALDRASRAASSRTTRAAWPLAEATAARSCWPTRSTARPLRPQHGFPLRLVVPGWYGMTSVKWLPRSTAVASRSTGYQQTGTYRLRQPRTSREPVHRMRARGADGPAGHPRLLDRAARSSMRGPVEVEGRAWSGRGAIAGVEVWSTAAGHGPRPSWVDQPARLPGAAGRACGSRPPPAPTSCVAGPMTPPATPAAARRLERRRIRQQRCPAGRRGRALERRPTLAGQEEPVSLGVGAAQAGRSRDAAQAVPVPHRVVFEHRDVHAGGGQRVAPAGGFGLARGRRRHPQPVELAAAGGERVQPAGDVAADVAAAVRGHEAGDVSARRLEG